MRLHRIHTVWIVSSEQLLAWVQNPTKASDLNGFGALKCSTPQVDQKICNGMPDNEAGLLSHCAFSDFPFYTCVSVRAVSFLLSLVFSSTPERDISFERRMVTDLFLLFPFSMDARRRSRRLMILIRLSRLRTGRRRGLGVSVSFPCALSFSLSLFPLSFPILPSFWSPSLPVRICPTAILRAAASGVLSVV
jgi:hypothetical protein